MGRQSGWLKKKEGVREKVGGVRACVCVCVCVCVVAGSTFRDSEYEVEEGGCMPSKVNLN